MECLDVNMREVVASKFMGLSLSFGSEEDAVALASGMR